MVYVSVGHTLILSWTNSHYWLRDHTSWALMELEWRLKVFPVLTIFVLKFITPRYTLLFSYSEIYKYMLSILNEVHPLFFLLRTCIFPSVRPLYMVNVGWVNSPRKSPSLNSVCERWSGNLVERSAHRIISQAFGRWIPTSVLMVVVLIIHERLSRRSLIWVYKYHPYHR